MNLEGITRAIKKEVEKIAGIMLLTCTVCSDGLSIEFLNNENAERKIHAHFNVVDYYRDEACGVTTMGISL